MRASRRKRTVSFPPMAVVAIQLYEVAARIRLHFTQCGSPPSIAAETTVFAAPGMETLQKYRSKKPPGEAWRQVRLFSPGYGISSPLPGQSPLDAAVRQRKARRR